MIEPEIQSQTAAGLLQYDAVRYYRATNSVSASGLILALVGGLLASILAGYLAWLWYTWKLPNFYVLPMLMQGTLVGLALAGICH